MRVFALMFVVAAGVLAYSRTLPQWTDRFDFDVAYEQLKDLDVTDHDAAMKAYGDLFDKHVTVRNALKKYSLCSMVLAGAGMLLSVRGMRGLRAPPLRSFVLATGVLAVGLSTVGLWLDTGEGYRSGETPVFGYDGREMLGVMGVGLYGLILVGLNSGALLGAAGASARMADIRLRGWDYVIAAELALSVGLAGLFAWWGGYFSLVATPAWFYFYLSILAFRTRDRRGMVSGLRGRAG